MKDYNIHFFWHQGWSQFPQRLQSNIDSVISKNPNWKVYKWDDVSIREELKNFGQQYLDKYDGFKLLHQKIDYARIILLHIYGGVSIDTDIVALKGFDSLPNINTSDFIVSEKSWNKSINNATIFSSKNNPILKHVIDNIDTTPCRDNESDYRCIQRTTGPQAFNKLLKPFRDQITVLDKDYLEPCTSLDSYCSPKENSVLDHRHELSWLKPYHKNAIKSYFFLKHYRYQIIVGILILALLIILLNRNNN